MAIYESGRALVIGSGTVAIGGRVATFSVDQNLKRGALIRGRTNVLAFTVLSGAGKKWHVLQDGGLASQTFDTNAQTATRARTTAWGSILPAGCPLFVYISRYDQNGNPDMYLYWDTLYPEKTVHPYTRDQWTGGSVITSYPQDAANNPNPTILQNTATRIRFLEGRVSALDASPPISDSLIGDPWR